MTAPIARIILRYIVLPLGLLVGLPEDTLDQIVSDPDVILALGAALALGGGLIETWYVLAKKKGGAT